MKDNSHAELQTRWNINVEARYWWKIMDKKYKIILDYINDLSIEIKDPEALFIARERLLKYNLDIETFFLEFEDKLLSE